MKKILFVLLIVPTFVFSQNIYWTQTNMTEGIFDAIIVNSSGDVFAGGQSEPYVFRSTDFGETWEQMIIISGIGILCFELSLDRSREGLIFAGTNTGIFVSSDNGNNWENRGLISYNISAILFHTNKKLYAGTSNNGIYESLDSGKTWSHIGPDSLNVSSLNEHPDGSVFATAYTGGIYHSDETVNNWALVGLPDASVRDLTICNGIIYVATMITFDTVGVFRSTNNGINWENIWPHSFYCSPEGGILTTSSGKIFLGGYCGVFYFLEYLYWPYANDGFPLGIYDVVSLAEGSIGENEVLYAGLYNSGIFKTNSLTSVEKDGYKYKFELKQNFPNPFNPSTKISYSVPKQSFVTLSIYDLLGREVTILVNEEKQAGSYEVEFKSKVGNIQLANGVYFYRLQVGDPSSNSGQVYVETKKMILMK